MKAQNNAHYFITFIHDFTRFDHLYLNTHKSDALDYFRIKISKVRYQIGKILKAALSTDRGRSNLSDESKCERKFSENFSTPRIINE